MSHVPPYTPMDPDDPDFDEYRPSSTWKDPLDGIDLQVKKLGHGNLRNLYPTVHVDRRLCGLELRGEEWVGAPSIPFRPSAMLLWDVPEKATVSYAIVGMEMQITASPAPVPARFFMTGHSFEDVVRNFEKEGIDAPYWCDFKTLAPGCEFRVRVRTMEGEPVRNLQGVLLGLGVTS